MKAGILSDSHDNRRSAEEALSLFLREGVGAIVHLGDVCRGSTLEGFRECGVPLVGVFGNNDRDKAGIQAATGSAFFRGPHAAVIGGRRVLMAHIFDELQAEIGEGGKYDLILFGHTHRPMSMRVGRALVLNPGEACGFAGGRATCAVVDLDAITARILEIAPGGRAAGEARGPAREAGS